MDARAVPHDQESRRYFGMDEDHNERMYQAQVTEELDKIRSEADEVAVEAYEALLAKDMDKAWGLYARAAKLCEEHVHVERNGI
jgi:hypothetical protein